jgi:hypothetical protein
MLTQTERAHWRLSWDERLARNARPKPPPSLRITIHGLTPAFAHAYGFSLCNAA